MKVKMIVAVISLAGMAGCVNNGTLLDYNNEELQIDTQYIGIPILLGGYGSSVPLTKTLSITAKHIAKLDYSTVVAYHPTCDIAIIEKDNSSKSIPKTGAVFKGESVMTLGRSALNPEKSIYGQGKYISDITIAKFKDFKDCTASLLTAPVQTGMSGGGVFNDSKELVGIISSIGYDIVIDNKQYGNKTMMVPYMFISDWVDTITAAYEINTR